MMIMSPEMNPMRLYRAVYRDKHQVERVMDMYAKGLAQATSTASYLQYENETLVRVYENPDW